RTLYWVLSPGYSPPTPRPIRKNLMSTPVLLSDYLDAAQQAARLGAAALEEWRPRFRVQEKARFDLVTDADLASQKTIADYLARRYPGHAFLGEEDRSPHARPGPDAPLTWIVDPLDGTTNYVHDCPLYCVSVGLHVAGELVVGAVYDPRHREMFCAGLGLGAWLNGERLRTSAADRLEEALLATGFPPDLRGQERTLDWFRYFSLRTRSLRRTGSTALNLVYVAAGRFGAYYAFDNYGWDVARRAGGGREGGGGGSQGGWAGLRPH